MKHLGKSLKFTHPQTLINQLLRVVACGLSFVMLAQAMPLSSIRSSMPLSSIAPQGREIVLPDGTEFQVITTEEISGKIAVAGDPLTFKVEDDVKVNGQVVIAEGTVVKGTVANAKKSGRLGKGGQLGIRIESTTAIDGQKIKLRATKASEGDDKTGTVIALSLLLSPLFFLKRGKDAKIKAGTKITVYTDETKSIQLKS
jgi:hypothetical protein